MYYNLFWYAFCKLALISSKILIEDAPGCFRIFTLMFSSLFMLLSWIPFNMESPMISICDSFFWLSFADLIVWFFTSLVIWFYWPTILFNCCDLFFYYIYTAIFIWIINTLGVVGCTFGWTLTNWDSICIFVAIILND